MKQILLIIIVSIVFASPAPGQTTSCNLQLDVYKFQDDAETYPIEIKKASVVLQKDKSKTKVKAVLQNEIPYFANLPAGSYNTVTSMKGYKVTTKEIDLDCSLANEQNVVSEVVFLWEGDIKETIKMNGGAFSVMGDNSEKPNKPIEGYYSKQGEKGEINGKAAYLPRPAYPRAAMAVKATGVVQIKVLINEIGKVIYSEAVGGHPMLRAAALKAAQAAKFTQTRLQGMPVKVSGIITYNFVP